MKYLYEKEVSGLDYSLCYDSLQLKVLHNHHKEEKLIFLKLCVTPGNWTCRYKARYAHKRLYTVLPKYSKIQVLPGVTSCRLVKDNKQAIELNSLLINNMPEGWYGWN